MHVAAPFPPKTPRLQWPRHALLAQLVEHLHGKEGVDGSSPSEGFRKIPANRRFLFAWFVNGRHARARAGIRWCSLERLIQGKTSLAAGRWFAGLLTPSPVTPAPRRPRLRTPGGTCPGRAREDRPAAAESAARSRAAGRRSASAPTESETHTQWAAREFGAESRWAKTDEGTLVAKGLDPRAVPRRARGAACARWRVARAGGERRRGRVFLSETLRNEPGRREVACCGWFLEGSA